MSKRLTNLELRQIKYGTKDGKPPRLPSVVPTEIELASDYSGIVCQSPDWRVIVVLRDYPTYVVLFNDPRAGGWRYAAEGFTRDGIGFYLDNCHFRGPSREFFAQVAKLPNSAVFPS